METLYDPGIFKSIQSWKKLASSSEIGIGHSFKREDEWSESTNEIQVSEELKRGRLSERCEHQRKENTEDFTEWFSFTICKSKKKKF